MCTICEYRAPAFESLDICTECLRCLFPAGYDLVPLCEIEPTLSLLPGGDSHGL